MKTLPNLVLRDYDATVDDVSADQRTVVSKITTEAIDRYKEVVIATGIDLAAYHTNPVVLLNHASYDVPIGRNLWIKLTSDKKGLVAKTQFRDDEDGKAILKLYQEGYMRGFSIGFRPDFDEMGPPKTDEVKARPELAECRCIYRKSELLEYSCVSIPANAEALAMAVSKGLHIPKGLIPEVEELPKLPAHVRTFDQVLAERLMKARKSEAAAIARELVAEALYYESGKP